MRNRGHCRGSFAQWIIDRKGVLSGLALLIAMLGLPAIGLAQEAASAPQVVEYRDIPQIGGSRNVIWVVAQLHLLLAGFVLGVPIFAWICEIVGWKTGEQRYDKLAKEFTKLLTPIPI